VQNMLKILKTELVCVEPSAVYLKRHCKTSSHQAALDRLSQ
jgi:hypothetical protein